MPGGDRRRRGHITLKGDGSCSGTTNDKMEWVGRTKRRQRCSVNAFKLAESLHLDHGGSESSENQGKEGEKVFDYGNRGGTPSQEGLSPGTGFRRGWFYLNSGFSTRHLACERRAERGFSQQGAYKLFEPPRLK